MPRRYKASSLLVAPGSSPCRDHWQHDMRRKLGTMMDGLNSNPCFRIQTEGVTCVGVSIEVGKVAAGHVDPDAVPLLEYQTGGLHLDHQGIHLAWLHELRRLLRLPI